MLVRTGNVLLKALTVAEGKNMVANVKIHGGRKALLTVQLLQKAEI